MTDASAPETPVLETPDLDALRERAADVAAILKLLSHPNRLLVACELMDGERSVSTIEADTGVHQPNLSRDLARLRAAGVVATRREAKQVFYRLADPRIQTLMQSLCAVFAPDGKPGRPSSSTDDPAPSKEDRS